MRRLPAASARHVPLSLGVALALTLVSGVGVAAVLPTAGAHHRASAVGGVAADSVATPALDRGVAVSRDRSAPARAVARVAPLRGLQVPDLQLRLPRSLTPAQAVALQHLQGLTGLAVLDTGRVHLGALTVSAVGVDPSQVRAFTPRETATSDPLWAAVARGEVAATYSLSRSAHLALGHPTVLAGRTVAPTRLGAVAVFGLPDAEVVLDRGTGRAVGLQRATTVLLAAPSRGLGALERDVRRIVPGATLTELRPAVVVPSRPRTYRELYMASARYCPGLSWTVLAAIGQVESGHGRNVGPSSAGALGPMQFLPSTWATSGVDGDGDGKADIMNPYDAVPAAALYLCRDGAGRGGQGLYDAIFSYNHADWYVREVLALAARYR